MLPALEILPLGTCSKEISKRKFKKLTQRFYGYIMYKEKLNSPNGSNKGKSVIAIKKL